MEEQHCATPTSYPSSTYHDRSFLYPHQREYSRRTLHEPPYPSQWSRRLDSESRQHHGEADSWHSRYAQPISRPDPTDSNTYRSRSPPNPSLPIRQPSEHPLARHSDAFEYPPNHIFYSRPAPPVPAYHDAPPPYEHPYPPHHHYPQHPQRYPRYPYPAPDHRYRSPEYPAPYPPSLPPAPPQCNCGDVACLEFSRSSRYTHDSRYVYRPHPPPRQPPPMPAYSAKEPVAHPESTSLNLDTKSSQKSGTSTIIALPKVSPTGGINVLAVEVSETVRGSMKTSIPPELVAKSDLPPANITEQKRYVCQHCNKAFSRPSSLTTHSYTHTGERPFGCTIPGCGRSFSVLSNLRRHLRICQRRRGGPSSSDKGSISLDDNASTNGSESGSTNSGGPIRTHSHTTTMTKRSRTTQVSIERTTDDGGSKKVVSVTRTEKMVEQREGERSDNDEMEEDEVDEVERKESETGDYGVERQLKKAGSLAELAEVAAAVAAASISTIPTSEEGSGLFEASKNRERL